MSEARADIKDLTLEKATMGLAYLFLCEKEDDLGKCELHDTMAVPLVIQRLRETLGGNDFGGSSTRELVGALELLSRGKLFHSSIVKGGALPLLECMMKDTSLPTGKQHVYFVINLLKP